MLNPYSRWYPLRKELRRLKKIVRDNTLYRTHRMKLEGHRGKYIEPREAVLQASFQALVNFVEEEMFDIIDWASMIDVENKLDDENWTEGSLPYFEHHREVYEEILRLYHWWKYVRPHRDNDIFSVVLHLAWDNINTMETEPIEGRDSVRVLPPGERSARHMDNTPLLDPFRSEQRGVNEDEEEDQRMLERLVKIREALWS